MNADGSNQANLTQREGIDMLPAWSRDGTRVAFLRPVNAANVEFHLFVMNADGTNATDISQSSVEEDEPVWSPDGQQIAFVSARDNAEGEVYVIPASGTAPPTRVTTNNLSERNLSWHPNGSQFAYSRDGDIFIMRIDGTNEVNLTNTPRVFELDPDFSPDGSQIAFVSFEHSDRGELHTLALANPAAQVRITNDALTNSSPSWSPDGAQLAFAGSDPATEMVNVFVIPVSGLGERTAQALTNDGRSFDPDWAQFRPGIDPVAGHRPVTADPWSVAAAALLLLVVISAPTRRARRRAGAAHRRT